MRAFFDDDKKQLTIVMTRLEVAELPDEKSEAWILNAIDGVTPIGKKIALGAEPVGDEAILWPKFAQDKERWAVVKIIEIKLTHQADLIIERCLGRVSIHQNFLDFEIQLNVNSDVEA